MNKLKLLKYRMTALPDPFDPPWQPPAQAFVFMWAEHAVDDALIEYEGPERFVRELKECVLRSYGARARIIEEYTAPRDLDNAMYGRLLSQYNPKMVAGQELFAQQDE